MTYPALLATDQEYHLKGYTGRFVICSYMSGKVEVINRDTGEKRLHDVDEFVKIGGVDNNIGEKK